MDTTTRAGSPSAMKSRGRRDRRRRGRPDQGGFDPVKPVLDRAVGAEADVEFQCLRAVETDPNRAMQTPGDHSRLFEAGLAVHAN